MAEPGYTVILPAHDEEATIGRALAAMGAGDDAAHRQVIVACNACADRTAQVARQAAPGAEVFEMAEGGKWRALNAAMERARHDIVFIVDADVEVSAAALDAMAAVLAGEDVWAVSPAVEFDMAGTDAWVRAYYRVFARHPYMHNGVGGCGVYGLSAEGRRRIGRFPPVTSDDGYVRVLLDRSRQLRLRQADDGTPVVSKVRPPRRLGELLKAEARWRNGDRELRGEAGALPSRKRVVPGMVRRGMVHPLDFAAYAAIKIMGRVLARLRPNNTDAAWHKDETSRG